MIMKKVVTVLLTLTILLSTEIAYSQSSFLKYRQSGIGLSAFLNSGENYTGFGASFGYSFASKFDLGLVVGRTNFDDEVIGRDGNGTSFSPFATVTLFKPSKISILGAELSASYGYGSYNSDELKRQNLDLSEDGINAGGTIYMRIETSPTLDVFPRLSIAYAKISQKLENAAGQSETATVEDVGYIVGIDFFFNDKVTIGPEFSTFDGNNSYKLIIGLVIPSS